ncbi:MAG TPA: hypothetical protein VFE24_08885 [Pirellulales bacterium]|nr:hypothetical protein [Pirellulales bacterium]
MPFGKVADDLFNHTTSSETWWSLAGDLALLFAGPLAKFAQANEFLVVARALRGIAGGLELSLAAYRLNQARRAIARGEPGEAAGYIG